MKNAIKILSLLIAALLLLPACNGATSESGPESPAPDNEKATGLPDAYEMRQNTWYLWLDKVSFKDLPKSEYRIAFSSVEEMKDAFLNLSFTETQMKILSREYLKNNDSFEVIDPRILAPVNLPDGVSLEKVWPSQSGAAVHFTLDINEEYLLGDDYWCLIDYKGKTGDSYIRTLENEWMDENGRYDTWAYSANDIHETTYKGVPALKLVRYGRNYVENGQMKHDTEETTVQWRYKIEKNNRLYYVTEIISYTDDTEQEIRESSVSAVVLHENHAFTYSITNPTTEVRNSIWEYDPFTYVEIVE